MRSKLNEPTEISAKHEEEKEQQHTSPIAITNEVRIRN